MLPAQREAPAKGAYSTAAERAFTGGAAGLGQFVRFAGPLALVWAGRSFVRTRGGCSYRVGVTRSIVGAPPRCEAKANQYTEPVRSHPGRVLLQGGGDAFSCRSTASVRSEGKPKHRACPVRTRGGCSLYVTQRSTDKVAHHLSGRPYAPGGSLD